ncbi:hypothetical protein CAK82_25210 [Klebsiella pneumoniae]|nr:hypothetical protein CAK82_25210 [Klebsiella pneumoniae]
MRPFTIIAGPNSSGKSFVTKALYSFFNTINNDHVTSSAFTSLTFIKSLVTAISYNLSRPSQNESQLILSCNIPFLKWKKLLTVNSALIL